MRKYGGHGGLKTLIFANQAFSKRGGALLSLFMERPAFDIRMRMWILKDHWVNG